jgi:hypothetical protein
VNDLDKSKKRWLREPLLHFVVLGAALFGIDQVLASRADDPLTIVFDDDVDAQARRIFASARGREPTLAELEALRQVWLDNEVLYREGIALQLDKGDPDIRDRVIFKALNVVEAGLKLPPFDDDVLREWFESHREKYDDPERYDFEEAVLSGSDEAALRDLAVRLNAGEPGDEDASLRVFTGRPHSNIVQSYGQGFASALESAQAGAWSVLASSDGPRLVRLVSISPPKPADFEALRGVVLQDWTDATMAEQRTAIVRALAKKYTVEVEAAGS